jgi:hypothetical protein
MYQELTLIPMYRSVGTNHVMNLPVTATDDEFFQISLYAKTLRFKDVELKPDSEGRVIISLAPLQLKKAFPEVEGLPETVEIPSAVLKERAYRRRLVYLSKDAVEILDYAGKQLFFYIQENTIVIKKFGFDDSGFLKIDPPEAEVTCDKIELKHGIKCINLEKMNLGHSHFPLSEETLRIWEPLLQEQALKSLCLIYAGLNDLNGKEYYRLSMELPQTTRDYLINCLEYCEDLGGYSGWMTSLPYTVADALKIQIKKRKTTK